MSGVSDRALTDRTDTVSREMQSEDIRNVDCTGAGCTLNVSYDVRREFSDILQGALGLFRWHKSEGIRYLELSESSISILDSVKAEGGKGSAGPAGNGKRQVSPEESATQTSPGAGQPGREIRPERSGFSPSEKNSPVVNRKASDIKGPAKSLRVAAAVDEREKSNSASSSESPRKVSDLVQFHGDIDSPIMFIAENLGYETPAGELFGNILKAMKLTKDKTLLCSFTPLDYSEGIPAVRKQVNTVRRAIEDHIDETRKRTKGRYPGVISVFGDTALKTVMGRDYMLTVDRGRFHDHNGTPLIATYHPDQVLVDSSLKKWVWSDMQMVMKMMGAGG